MSYRKDGLLDTDVLASPVWVRSLIAAGADVNTRNKRGRTPLHLTVTPETAIALLEAGADWTPLDNEGMTAAEFDRMALHGEVAQTIEQWVATKLARERAKSLSDNLEEAEVQQGPGL